RVEERLLEPDIAERVVELYAAFNVGRIPGADVVERLTGHVDDHRRLHPPAGLVGDHLAVGRGGQRGANGGTRLAGAVVEQMQLAGGSGPRRDRHEVGEAVAVHVAVDDGRPFLVHSPGAVDRQIRPGQAT